MPKQTIYSRPNRPFRVEPYDPKWASRFQTLAAEINSLLGPEVIRIEHVGSTSVPGMTAKPQIDILVEAKDLTRIRNHYEVMRAAGYEPKGDYVGNGEEFFAKDLPGGSRLVSVHVLPAGHKHIQQDIVFRDYLRSHPDEVAGYSHAKQAAFRNHPHDYNAYFKAKSPYVVALVARAEAWNEANPNKPRE